MNECGGFNKSALVTIQRNGERPGIVSLRRMFNYKYRKSFVNLDGAAPVIISERRKDLPRTMKKLQGIMIKKKPGYYNSSDYSAFNLIIPSLKDEAYIAKIRETCKRLKIKCFIAPKYEENYESGQSDDKKGPDPVIYDNYLAHYGGFHRINQDRMLSKPTAYIYGSRTTSLWNSAFAKGAYSFIENELVAGVISKDDVKTLEKMGCFDVETKFWEEYKKVANLKDTRIMFAILCCLGVNYTRFISHEIDKIIECIPNFLVKNSVGLFSNKKMLTKNMPVIRMAVQVRMNSSREECGHKDKELEEALEMALTNMKSNQTLQKMKIWAKLFNSYDIHEDSAPLYAEILDKVKKVDPIKVAKESKYV